MMHMTFYWGKEATILFDPWRTTSWPGYAVSLAALLVVAAFYQYMEGRRIRIKVLAMSKAGAQPAPPSLGSPLLIRTASSSSVARIAVAAMFAANSAVGYLLMLAVMSFNGGVFIAVVAGLAVGYFFFRSGGDDDLVVLENPCACA